MCVTYSLIGIYFDPGPLERCDGGRSEVDTEVALKFENCRDDWRIGRAFVIAHRFHCTLKSKHACVNDGRGDLTEVFSCDPQRGVAARVGEYERICIQTCAELRFGAENIAQEDVVRHAKKL